MPRIKYIKMKTATDHMGKIPSRSAACAIHNPSPGSGSVGFAFPVKNSKREKTPDSIHIMHKLMRAGWRRRVISLEHKNVQTRIGSRMREMRWRVIQRFKKGIAFLPSSCWCTRVTRPADMASVRYRESQSRESDLQERKNRPAEMQIRAASSISRQ